MRVVNAFSLWASVLFIAEHQERQNVSNPGMDPQKLLFVCHTGGSKTKIKCHNVDQNCQNIGI